MIVHGKVIITKDMKSKLIKQKSVEPRVNLSSRATEYKRLYQIDSSDDRFQGHARTVKWSCHPSSDSATWLRYSFTFARKHRGGMI